PEFHVEAAAVSNNHFDEDGLAGLYAILHPEDALALEPLLVDVAAAGDFGTYRFPEAARAVFVLSAFADPDLSPFGSALFARPYPRGDGPPLPGDAPSAARNPQGVGSLSRLLDIRAGPSRCQREGDPKRGDHDPGAAAPRPGGRRASRGASRPECPSVHAETACRLPSDGAAQ